MAKGIEKPLKSTSALSVRLQSTPPPPLLIYSTYERPL